MHSDGMFECHVWDRVEVVRVALCLVVLKLVALSY